MSSTAKVTRVLGIMALAVGSALPAGAQEVDASRVQWQECPCQASLGSIAEINLPEGYKFADREGTKRFLELTQNPTSGRELGVVIRDTEAGAWFVVFEFKDIGYVKDDEKDTLDGEALLKSIKTGTENANEERKKRGWSTMSVVGWERRPAYDAATHNLTWAIRGRSDGSDSVNYSVRLLGRGGVMDADLVLAPEHLASALPEFNQVLGDFAFKPGQKYAEFRQGDKIAAYGLTALVVGGAGAAAVKSGLLAKLWKAIVGGVVALVALVKRLFKGRSESESTA